MQPITSTAGPRPVTPAKVLLTGRPGVGKTTVVLRTVELLRAVAGGFYTEEMREAGRRVGFRVRDIASGVEGILSHVDFSSRYRVGKYGVDVEAFERVGVAALQMALLRKGCVVLDEIGKMELCCRRFREVVKEALAAQNPVLASVPMFRHPFLDALRSRPGATLIHVTHANREKLPATLAGRLNPPPACSLGSPAVLNDS